jgi:Protein of unknown function (DUF3592)
MLFGFLLLICCGTIFALACINSVPKRWRKRSWRKVSATVKNIETKIIYTDEGAYQADVLSYEYFHGDALYQGTTEKRVSKFQLGHSLLVRYNPENPREHELPFFGEWLLQLLFDLLGFALLCSAYLLSKSL